MQEKYPDSSQYKRNPKGSVNTVDNKVLRFQINFYNLTQIYYIYKPLLVFFSSAFVPAVCSLKEA